MLSYSGFLSTSQKAFKHCYPSLTDGKLRHELAFAESGWVRWADGASTHHWGHRSHFPAHRTCHKQSTTQKSFLCKRRGRSWGWAGLPGARAGALGDQAGVAMSVCPPKVQKCLHSDGIRVCAGLVFLPVGKAGKWGGPGNLFGGEGVHHHRAALSRTRAGECHFHDHCLVWRQPAKGRC